MATLVADTFTRADSTSIVGPSEVGAVTPTVVAGTAGILTNRLYFSATASAVGLISWECGTPDVDLSVDWAVISTSFSIAIGVNTNTDYLRLVFPAAAGAATLAKMGAGQNFVTCGSWAVPVAVAGTTYRVVVKSGRLAFYIGGTQYGRFDLSLVSSLAVTKHGVHTPNTANRFDNLSIVDSSVIDNSNDGLLYKGRDTATADAAGVA